MDQLKEMGEFVRSASSTIEAPVVRRLKEAFSTKTAEQPAQGARSRSAGGPAAPVGGPAVPRDGAVPAGTRPRPDASPAPTAPRTRDAHPQDDRAAAAASAAGP